MSDQLDALWNAYGETPFPTLSIQRKLNLSPGALARILDLLKEMNDTGETKNGYRVKRVASRIYKLIKTQASGDDSPKGRPLTEPKETLTGEVRRPISDLHPQNDPCEQFSFFPSAKQSQRASKTGNIDQFHKQLTTNTAWEKRIESLQPLSGDALKHAKESLPAITPSVLITSGKRANLSDGDFTHTHLIQADFDDCPNPDALLNTLKTDPHTRLIFRSPRGKAKAFFRVHPINTEVEHKAAFQAVADYCRGKGYGEIDPTCKDLVHLCFISFDPQAVLKHAEPLSYEMHLSFFMQHSPPSQRPELPYPIRRDIRQVIDALDAIPADDYLTHWIEIGCALYHSDIPDANAFQLWDTWSQKSPRYDQTPDQMRYKWKSFATVRENRHGIGYIYYLANQHGWQPSPREIKRRKKKHRYRGGY